MKMIKVTKNKILSEGLSSLLYHFTSIDNVVNIIKQDRLLATSAMASVADGGSLNRNKHFYVSFQRSRNASIGYAGSTGGKGCCIEFDGQALNAKYKGTAADYWQRGKDPNNGLGIGGVMRNNELEDRLVIDSPFIPNIRRYIKSVHIKVDEPTRNGKYGHRGKIYGDIDRYCNQLGIAVYFYDTDKKFNSGRIEQSKSLSDMITGEPKSENETYPEDLIGDAESLFRNIVPFFVYRDEKNAKLLDRLFPSVNFSDYYSEDTLRQLKYRYLTKRNGAYESYYVDELKSIIYNEVSQFQTNKNYYVLEFFRVLSRELRRYGANDVREWVENKIKKIDEKDKEKLDASENKKNTDIAYVWRDVGGGKYENLNRENLEDYFEFREDLEEELEKYISTKEGLMDTHETFHGNYQIVTFKDLLGLLNRHLTSSQCLQFLKSQDLVGINQRQKENSYSEGGHLFLYESKLQKYIKNFLSEQLI